MIYVDLDSTLTDNLYRWIDFINSKNGTKYTVKDIKQFNDKILTDNLDYLIKLNYKDILPLPGAYDFLLQLKNFDNVRILSTTNVNDIRFVEQKEEFVNKHFKGFKLIQVLKDIHKVYLISDNDILIDDKLEIIENLKPEQGIVFTNDEYNYNKTKDYFRGGYKRIITFLKFRFSM